MQTPTGVPHFARPFSYCGNYLANALRCRKYFVYFSHTFRHQMHAAVPSRTPQVFVFLFQRLKVFCGIFPDAWKYCASPFRGRKVLFGPTSASEVIASKTEQTQKVAQIPSQDGSVCAPGSPLLWYPNLRADDVQPWESHRTMLLRVGQALCLWLSPPPKIMQWRKLNICKTAMFWPIVSNSLRTHRTPPPPRRSNPFGGRGHLNDKTLAEPPVLHCCARMPSTTDAERSWGGSRRCGRRTSGSSLIVVWRPLCLPLSSTLRTSTGLCCRGTCPRSKPKHEGPSASE